MLRNVSFLLLIFSLMQVRALSVGDTLISPVPAVKEVQPWYKLISLRGYTQIRYNRLFETNPDLGCEQCDKSWGGNNGVFLRRGRLIFSGDVHPKVYIYIQFDFAAAPSSSQQHFLQVRDAYFDLALDEKREFRLRVGQSKVPFGYENLQSSQNRLPLDRGDGLNSAVPNERDLGAFFYWAPERARAIYKDLVRRPAKGSGDYGVFALGFFNGQTANRPELNNNLHVVARLSYPFTFGNQVFEPGIQGYTGKYTLPSENVTADIGTASENTYTDERAAISLVLQPRPFGVLAEYNIGRGPRYLASGDTITTQELQGGQVTLSYMIKAKEQYITPFFRAQYFDGGKKAERDARSYKVNEYESGVEWQPNAAVELTAMYTYSIRAYEDARTEGNKQEGSLLRLQLQINF